MSSITERFVLRVERWLDRLVLPKVPYACGGCDDRFVSRSVGIAHALRCHPEFQGIVVYEDGGCTSPSTSRQKSD